MARLSSGARSTARLSSGKGTEYGKDCRQGRARSTARLSSGARSTARLSSGKGTEYGKDCRQGRARSTARLSSEKGTEYGNTIVREGQGVRQDCRQVSGMALKGDHPDFARLYACENVTRHKSISFIPLCTQ